MSALVQLLRTRKVHHNVNGARRTLHFEDWADADGVIHFVFRIEVSRFRPQSSGPNESRNSARLDQLEREIYGR